MQWVKFTKPFDFTPEKKPLSGLSWPAGAVDSVTDEAAKKAIAKGRAFRVQDPKNAEEAAAFKAGTAEPKPYVEPAAKAEEAKAPAK
jgi:hypothetical protein